MSKNKGTAAQALKVLLYGLRVWVRYSKICSWAYSPCKAEIWQCDVQQNIREFTRDERSFCQLWREELQEVDRDFGGTNVYILRLHYDA